MDWKEFQEGTRALSDYAAQKINTVSDLAALHLRLKTLEYRLKSLYEEFGKTAYADFTSESEDSDGLQAITKYVEAITLIRTQITNVKKKIRSVQSPNS